MKRAVSIALIALLLFSVAFAEGVQTVNDLVAQQGYKAASVKNKTGLTGCWFAEDADGETLQWSDQKRVYTVSAKAGSGLRLLYADILGLVDWDTCTFTANDNVLFAFNAPDLNAAKDYKTLRNYARYVTEYIDETNDVQDVSAGGYVINLTTKKFHRPDCPSASRIKKDNKQIFKGRRSELINQGYEPCKNCNP